MIKMFSTKTLCFKFAYICTITSWMKHSSMKITLYSKALFRLFGYSSCASFP